MTTLSPAQIANLTQRYFGDLGPQVVADMTAIALAESGGNAAAANLNPATRDDSHGLWQINVRPDANPQYASWDLANPDQNAKAARQIYDQGGYGPWSTWGNGDALDHWDDAAQAVTGLYTQTDNKIMRNDIPGTRNPAYKQAIGATIAQSGVGSPPVATAAPQTVNTGEDITKLYYWVLQQLQQLGTGASATTGMYPSELAGGQAGQWSPTQAKQQWDQTYQAQRDDANRNYALNLQRFGLDYANTAFNQQIAAADAARANLALEVQKQGPADWLKYNYIINNRPAPPSPTADGTKVPTPGQIPVAPVGSAQPAPAANPQADAEARAKALSTAYNAGNYGAYQAGGGTAPPPVSNTPAPAQTNVQASVGPASPTPPDASGRTPAMISADNAQAMASYGNIPKLAFGGQSAPLDGDVLMPGDESGPPPPPGGGFIEWLHRLYEADMASQGGSALPGGGPSAAVVGDPQSPRDQPDANPELVTSLAPFNVTPLNRMDAGERDKARALPHKATGGLVFGQSEAMDAPFVQKQLGGGAAFGERGEDLGAYGKQPLSYANYLQLLPSEQAMTQGYINTPTAQGGLGGVFDDELERARRSAFTGPRDYPYRQSNSAGYEA